MAKRFLGLAILILCLAVCADAFAKDLKMGSVNMQRVTYDYKKAKDFTQKLEKEDAAVRGEIEERTGEIRKLRDEMDILSEEARVKKEPEMRKKIKELDDFRRDKVEGFLRRRDEMFKEIRKDILDVASRYATKNGYDMLFYNEVFVYSSKNYDITDKILKELNK